MQAPKTLDQLRAPHVTKPAAVTMGFLDVSWDCSPRCCNTRIVEVEASFNKASSEYASYQAPKDFNESSKRHKVKRQGEAVTKARQRYLAEVESHLKDGCVARFADGLARSGAMRNDMELPHQPDVAVVLHVTGDTPGMSTKIQSLVRANTDLNNNTLIKLGCFSSLAESRSSAEQYKAICDYLADPTAVFDTRISDTFAEAGIFDEVTQQLVRPSVLTGNRLPDNSSSVGQISTAYGVQDHGASSRYDSTGSFPSSGLHTSMPLPAYTSQRHPYGQPTRQTISSTFANTEFTDSSPSVLPEFAMLSTGPRIQQQSDAGFEMTASFVDEIERQLRSLPAIYSRPIAELSAVAAQRLPLLRVWQSQLEMAEKTLHNSSSQASLLAYFGQDRLVSLEKQLQVINRCLYEAKRIVQWQVNACEPSLRHC